MNTLKTIALTIAALGASLVGAHAAQISSYDLPAVGGYDLVSYHQDSGPVRGTGFHAAQHDGVTYLFSSEENKATFEANPDAYLPAYNGFCAFGLALGEKFNSDPLVYEIVDGRLFLNLDREIQKKWVEEKTANIEKGDANWAKEFSAVEVDSDEKTEMAAN